MGTIANLIDELARVMGYEVRIFTDEGEWFVDVCESPLTGGAFLFQNYSVDLTLALDGAYREMVSRNGTGHPAWCVVVEAHSREDCTRL